MNWCQVIQIVIAAALLLSAVLGCNGLHVEYCHPNHGCITIDGRHYKEVPHDGEERQPEKTDE